MSETGEVERLQARVNELEARLAVQQAAPQPGRAPRQRRKGWGRSFASAVLIVLACLLAPLSVASVWASSQVSDTERYVATVAPLAHDPAVQKAVATALTQEILQRVDVQGFTSDALGALADQPKVPPRIAALLPSLAVPITNGIEGFTRSQVDKFVASSQFVTLWEQANRVAHDQLVHLLSGTQGTAVTAQGDSVTLNLAPLIQQVKHRLVARGFSLADNIPVVDKSFVLVRSDSVTKAQSFYRALNALGSWLPLIAVVLFGLGVLLAREHMRALMVGAFGVVGTMLLLGVLLAIARLGYLNAVPTDVLPQSAAGDVFDTLVRFLRSALRAVAVLFLLIGVGAYVAGSSSSAGRIRGGLGRGIGSLRSGAESAGWRTGRFGTWMYQYKRVLWVVTVVLAGLVIAFWTRPTAAVVVVTALVALVLIGLIEFLAQPPSADAPPSADDPVLDGTPSEPGPEDTQKLAATASGGGSIQEERP